MPALTSAQEYDLVRQAIQTLTSTGQSTVSFTLGDMSVTYLASQLDTLMRREEELARRIALRNQRKRTTAAFDY